ncbi:response regulator [Fibrella aquatilis]|uniref:Response regulator n=1 Tax=Fibrella aquatilis TaxID=2817059 RepID=A0A939G1G7_9BACT|nr:response regulator [Fibrella aquatilis]MBO0930672.1 response regulator [Fibrella aquatilis]
MSQNNLFLVDDDEDDIYLARLTFSEHFPDWKLTSFSDGQELVDYVSEHTTQPLPDLIILDLNMPRLTGFEALALLKQNPNWQRIPVAILTTSSSPEDRNRSEALGACAFMTKPASIDQLASLITISKLSAANNTVDSEHNR